MQCKEKHVVSIGCVKRRLLQDLPAIRWLDKTDGNTPIVLLAVRLEHWSGGMTCAAKDVPQLLSHITQVLELINLVEDIVKEEGGSVFRRRSNPQMPPCDNIRGLLDITRPVKVNQINNTSVLVSLRLREG